MKKISLQWRITLMTALLIGITCIAMNLLLCSSGIYYMDTIADTLQGSDRILLDEEDTVSFDPQLAAPDGELTILIDGAQGRFRTTNWYITAVVTALSGILAYFVSGHALKPLRSFASQTEKVQLNNLADIRINENVLPEFRQLGHSLNQMLERLPGADAGPAGAFLCRASRHAAGDGRLSLPAAGTDRAAVPDDKNPAGDE